MQLSPARVVAQHLKRGGYSHSWTFLPRVPALTIDVPTTLRQKLYEALEMLKNMEQKGYARFVPSWPSSVLDIKVGFRPLSEYLVDAAEGWDQWAEQLAATGWRGLAKTALSFYNTMTKKVGALEKKAETFERHHGTYKGKAGTAERAYDGFIKTAKPLFTKVARFLASVLSVVLDSEASVEDFGFLDDEWPKVVAAAKGIAAAAKFDGIELDDDIGSNGIWINGVGDDAHEDFVLEKHPDGIHALFAFCKTNRYPYDDVVVSVLAAAKKIAPDALNVRSDGGPSAIKRIYSHYLYEFPEPQRKSADGRERWLWDQVEEVADRMFDDYDLADEMGGGNYYITVEVLPEPGMAATLKGVYGDDDIEVDTKTERAVEQFAKKMERVLRDDVSDVDIEADPPSRNSIGAWWIKMQVIEK
jgi:hypothetical protein